MDNAWIAALKPGDKVIFADGRRFHSPEFIRIVERTTKTQIILAGSSVFRAHRFRRDSGTMIGAAPYESVRLEQATPERIEAVRKERRLQTMRVAIKNAAAMISDPRVTDETIQAIYDACAPLRAFATERTAS